MMSSTNSIEKLSLGVKTLTILKEATTPLQI